MRANALGAAALGLWLLAPPAAAAAEPAPDYGERYRPQFHFTPARNFMNDPNGLVFHDGRWHLFYQHNPFGDRWGHMSWGHAVSRDLVRWEHRPVALPEEGDTMAWSGSAVVDRENTSGLCDPARAGDCLVAVYTSRTPELQTQSLAVSRDGGATWERYAGNPVLDIGVKDFRDPKVFWHAPTRRWVMAVVKAAESKVMLFGSPNLREWTLLSEFGPAGARRVTWECPDLFELPVEGDPAGATRWVLKVDINPGAIQGGSGSQYFVGTFDGTAFASENPPDQVLWTDHGKDFYAAQSWSDVPAADGRRVWVGWLSNWQYASIVPTSPWRGAQSVPREVTLRRFPEGVRLVQEPVAELASLRRDPDVVAGRIVSAVDETLAARGGAPVGGTQLEIDAVFRLGDATEVGLVVRRGANGREETVVGYDAVRGQVFVDRSASGEVGFHPGFPGKHAAPLAARDGQVRLRVLVDASSVEVFGGAGEAVISDLIFPAPESDGLRLYTRNGDAWRVSLDVWRLASAWRGS
jgi:fructan beta-fructosidase